MFELCSNFISCLGLCRFYSCCNNTHALFENDLSECKTAVICKCAVEIKLQFVANLTARHCEDKMLIHARLNLFNWWEIFHLLLQLSSIRQLHPHLLELIALDVARRIQLNHCRRRINRFSLNLQFCHISV